MQLHDAATNSAARGIASERGVHAASMDSLNGASFLSRIASEGGAAKRRERRAPMLR